MDLLKFVPVLCHFRDHFFPEIGEWFQVLTLCTLIGINFLFTTPYILVAARGTRGTGLLLIAALCCTLEALNQQQLIIFP